MALPRLPPGRGSVSSASCLLAVAMACLAAAPAPAAEPAPAPAAEPAPASAPRFGDEIAVRLVTVVVRVVDGAGEPVLGLTPADLRVRVGGREVSVTAVDWVAAGGAGAAAAAEPAGAAEPAAAAAPPGPAEPAGAPGTAASGPAQPRAAAVAAAAVAAASTEAPSADPPGKLVVIFVQADNNSPSRVRGHLRTLPFTRELLDSLQPADRVAVVSFDSHLKLWRDFTRDRETVPAAIYQAIHFGGRPPAALSARDPAPAPAPESEPAAGGPSLARHLDFDAALRAASPERALAVTAAALSALPGEKEVVFLAWGLGDFSTMGTRMTPAFAPAVRALAAARATVFVLDVTEADSHSLEVGLQGIAEATGGTYDKTNLFPSLAMRQLARTMSGYYVLSLDAAALPESGGGVEVELRGRRGTVLLRPAAFPAAAGGRSR
jgi:VWFA-related protein